MQPKKYTYKGAVYTLAELSRLFPHIKYDRLVSRLRKGMTVEEAIAPQTWEEHIPEKYRHKNLVVCFDDVPPVYPIRQPELGKRYLAVPHAEEKGTKMFYVVRVRGNPLIVYPGEFRILGVARKCEGQECSPPYGEIEDCEMYVSGYCIGSYEQT